MSLKIEIDNWDYQQAVKKVQEMLDKIRIGGTEEEPEVTDVPDADDIVDAVWYIIN